MPAGSLRERVTIEAPSVSPDAAGQLATTWTTHCERWAEALPTSGSETVEGKQLKARTAWTLRVRFDDETQAITTKMRVRFRGRTLNIGRVNDVEGRRRMIELDCTETA